MKFRKDDDGKLVLDDNGDPIAVSDKGNVIDLTKIVSEDKHNRIASEREEYKSKVEELQKQIGELSAKSESAEELQKQIAELKASATESESEWKAKLEAREKDHALDTALLGAGVPDKLLKAAKAMIDPEKGFEPESFKSEYPSFFAPVKRKDSAGQPAGTEDGSDLIAAVDAVFPAKKG